MALLPTGRGHGNRNNPPPRQLEKRSSNSEQSAGMVSDGEEHGRVFSAKERLTGAINLNYIHSRRLHTQKEGVMTCLVHTCIQFHANDPTVWTANGTER